MITINLPEKDAEILKSFVQFSYHAPSEHIEVAKEVVKQINNQQFDVSEFESSRQYEALSVNAAHLTNWDKATKK